MSLIGDLVIEGLFSGVAEAIAELPPPIRNTLTGLAGLCLAGAVGATIAMSPAVEALANDRQERAFALFALLGCLAAAALGLASMAF